MSFTEALRKARWKWHASRIETPVEYICVQSCYPDPNRKFLDPEHPALGWIPRPIFESVTGDTFVSGRPYFIREDHGKKLRGHPLWVDDETFQASGDSA